MSLWNHRPLKPESEADIKAAETCDGKRAALERYSYDDALTRQAFRMAAIFGMSGEDKYTTLAYHALLSLEQTRDYLLRTLELMPMPPLVMTSRDVQRDAARYRHLRQSFHLQGTFGHCLQWNLPNGHRNEPLDVQLDDSIDEAIAGKS